MCNDEMFLFLDKNSEPRITRSSRSILSLCMPTNGTCTKIRRISANNRLAYKSSGTGKTCTLCCKTFTARLGSRLPFSSNEKWKPMCECGEEFHAECAFFWYESHGGEGCPRCNSKKPLDPAIIAKARSATMES